MITNLASRIPFKISESDVPDVEFFGLSSSSELDSESELESELDSEPELLGEIVFTATDWLNETVLKQFVTTFENLRSKFNVKLNLPESLL